MCGCQAFQDENSPCSYSIAGIYGTEQAPINFMPEKLSCNVYINMYSHNIPSINLTYLTLKMQQQNYVESSAPITEVLRGRPRKQRFRAGEMRIQVTRCSTCRKEGHNTCTC